MTPPELDGLYWRWLRGLAQQESNALRAWARLGRTPPPARPLIVPPVVSFVKWCPHAPTRVVAA